MPAPPFRLTTPVPVPVPVPALSDSPPPPAVVHCQRVGEGGEGQSPECTERQPQRGGAHGSGPGSPGKVRGRAAVPVFMVPQSPRPGRYIHACFRTRGAAPR